MAKKWSKKEINEYLSTKQISQENYVAPTVQTNYQPSIESTVNAFNSVQPTVSQPKIQTTVKQPTIGEGLGYVGESALSGFTSGTTAILDAPLQNAQEGVERARNKSTKENLKDLYLKTILPGGLGNVKDTVEDAMKIMQDPNKKGWQKALNVAMELANSQGITKKLENVGQMTELVKGLVGQDTLKEIKKTREVIETPGNKLQEDVAKKSENMSKGWNIAGQTSQTIGNMLPSMAISALTKNPDIGLAAMGVSAKGQATKEAEEKGANISEANAIGLAKGTTEVATEKITGGLKYFGKGTADDIAENIINRTIKNKAGNFIAKQGLGIGGEVFEETLSDLVGTAIDKATVDPNATYTFDDWKNTALMTVLSTGALNTLSGGYSRSAYQLNAQELEQIAQNEKVQQTVEARVNELKTPDMTPEQIENLKIDVRADILGDIQENINNIVNETQNITQIPTQTPLNEVNQEVLQQNNQILGQEQTPQITPLNQVNQELQETRQQDVADSVRAMNLETEPEFTQKQGNYVYEKSDNSKIDNLRKDAATYLKEGEQTTNFVNTLEKLVKDKDIEIRFDTKLGNNVNGTYKNGVITINPNSNRAGEFVAIHELTHAIGTKPMIDMIQTYRKSNAEFNNAVERLLSTYNTTEINEEALGDIAGQLFGNQEYINNLSMENPSLFKKIYNEIKYLWHQFTGYKNQDQFIEDLRNKWESAYRNSKAKQTNKIGYSINGDGRDFFYRGQQKEGTDLSYNDTQFQGSEDDGYYFTPNKKTANKYGKNIIERFRDENNTVTVEESDRLQEMATKKLEEHMKEGKWYEEDDLLEQMALGRSKAFAEYTGKPFVETGDMFGEDAEAVYYPEFDKDTKYSIEEIKKEPIKDNTGRELSDVDNYVKNNNFSFKQNGGLEVSNLSNKQIKTLLNLYKTTGYEDVSTDYLSERLKQGNMVIPREVADRFIEKELGYKPQIDKTKVFEDSEGRKLTKEQVEFYKDSDVRDIRGRLIPVFHRTNAEFTVFDTKAGKQHGAKYGPGIYFSITPENYGNNTIEAYLNAKDGEYKYVPKMGYYIVQNSNQIKNVDNTNPTNDPDIRYSKDNQTWREYLEKEFPSQGTRTDLQGINERNKPKQENKTTQEEKPQEMPKNEVKQEIKKEQKSFLTSNEQQELDNLRDWKENGAWDLSKEEQTRLDELERKSQGITKKFPDLKKTVTQEDTKPIYFKYKDNQISKENNKVLKQAESVVPANNQGRRTKEQWLKVAEYIGSNADVKTSSQLQQLAMETWLETRPNTKSNLNRQGSKYVDFKTNEWFNAMYKGAGVGTDVKMSLEEATDSKGKKVDLMPTSDNTYEKVNVKPKQNEIISKEDIKNEVLKIGDEKVSNFYSNATEKSKFITEENRVKLMDNDNLKYYDAINNKDTLQNALDKLDTDAEQQVGDFFAKKDFTAEDVATGWILVKRYQDAGNFEAMSNVLERMREQGTKAGQTIQMYGMLQRLTPEGMEYYAQKQLDNAYNKFVENKSKKQIDKYAKEFTLTAEEHQFIKDTMEKVQNMTDEDAKKVEIGKIVRMLSDKLPPEKGQRIKAWMRISMLGNPKTQVRNVVGNAIIQPVNWVGDIFATKADQIMSKRTGIRTKGNTNFEALTKGFVKGGKDAIRDSKLGIDTRDINLDRFEENIGAKPFYEGHKSQALNKAAKVLNKTNQILGDVMSGGDRIFYQSIYDNSLQNQMKLNKVSVPTQEMMDIAQQEALSRTWNDSNSYTKAVLQIRNAMNKLNVKGYGLGDVLVPFAKTPANLTKAIVDYSPVGLARTIIQDGNNYRNSLQNGQYNAQLQHKFADSFGKGMAGSMLWVAAYALAKAGITSGKSDDDKDVANFMRNTLGIQPYSIKIGDKSFTYDWAQPIAAPFAAMADFQSLTDSEKKDMGSIIERMTSSASNILLEQSFLSSIQDVFNSYEGPAAAIKQQIQDLPARATPTFFKQIADLIDPTSRQTYVKGDTKETMKNKVQVKIPGASKELAEQRDTLGREIKKYGGDDNKLKYAFNVFLNPANTNKGKPSKAAEEIYEVYKATGDKTIMPRQVGYSEMISGKSRNLTAKERSEWQKRAGQKVEENVKALTLNPEYNELSNEDKATVISNIVNYSFSIQKEEMFDAGVSNLYKKAYEAEQDGIPIADFYLEKMQKYIDKYR